MMMMGGLMTLDHDMFLLNIYVKGVVVVALL